MSLTLNKEQLSELIHTSHLDRRGNLHGTCPKCNHNEFSISLSTNNPFGCFRMQKCGFRGNIYTLLKFLGKLQDYVDVDNYQRGKGKLVSKIFEQEVNLDLETISEPIGWKRVYSNEYLDLRGFNEYSRYKVGRSIIDPKTKKNYVTFLVEEKGEIKGWIGRHIWSKERIERQSELNKEKGLPKILRYINSQSDFSKLLFGYDEIDDETDTVIIVEGIFDKFNVDKLLNLHDDSKVKCVCSFKCDLSLEQVYKLQMFPNISNIILFYDSDVIEKTKTVSSFIEDKFEDVKIALPDNKKDPGEIDESELITIFSNLYSILDFSVKKVSIKKLL